MVGLLVIWFPLAAFTSPWTPEDSAKAMYDFWCTKERAQSFLCQHYSSFVKMRQAAHVATNKKTIRIAERDEHKGRFKNAAGKVTSLVPQKKKRGEMTMEYSAMKTAFCASKSKYAPLLCHTHASLGSRYSSASTLATVLKWYCNKNSGSDAADNSKEICNGYSNGVLLHKHIERRNNSTSSKSRTRVTATRKQPLTIAQKRIVYYAFCKVPDHANGDESSICKGVWRMQQNEAMMQSYCAAPKNANGQLCNRSKIIKELKAANASPTMRKQRMSDLAKMTKGDAARKAMTTEMREAKKSYCKNAVSGSTKTSSKAYKEFCGSLAMM